MANGEEYSQVYYYYPPKYSQLPEYSFPPVFNYVHVGPLPQQIPSPDFSKPPPALLPPSLIPPSLIPPSLIPPSLIPPSLNPPSLNPPSLNPPSLIPPSLNSPSLNPPSIVPPSLHVQNKCQQNKPAKRQVKSLKKQKQTRYRIRLVTCSTQTDDSKLLFMMDDLTGECGGCVNVVVCSKGNIRHVSTQLDSGHSTHSCALARSNPEPQVSYSDILKGKARSLNSSHASKNACNSNLDVKEGDGAIASGTSEGKSRKNKFGNLIPIKHSKPNKAPVSLFEFIQENENMAAKPRKPIAEPMKIVKECEKGSLIGNTLDTSQPTFHKGKSRDRQKERPTTMRKIISREIEVSKDEVVQVEGQVEGAANNKFTEYCSNAPRPELDAAVVAFLDILRGFQDKMHLKDPNKAKLKRRYVCGLREVRKFVSVEKVCCVIVAPDIQKITSAGGLDDVLGKVLEDCVTQGVPVVFALKRRTLGRTVHKSSAVACVGVLNAQGAQLQLKEVLQQLELATKDMSKNGKINETENTLSINENDSLQVDEGIKTSNGDQLNCAESSSAATS